MVYVISKNNNPLMPTKRHAKVRLLLKNKQAKVVNNKPFTIQLLCDSKEYTQPVKLGVDSGYTYIGYSAITKDKEILCGEVTLLSGVKERLKEKAMYRRQRRGRKRYRKPRFNNRKRPKGWLAPSVQHKLDSHIRFIEYIKSILPVSDITIEVANFDIQKIKNPVIEGEEYQNGEQKDFFNLREYILHRDNHTCQYCKATELALQVHHIGYWKADRSNRPSNLITLCVKCHLPKNHKETGFLNKWQPKLKTFKEATFMSMVRWRLVNQLNCNHTYGSETKSKRINLGIEKTHCNDAFVIAGGELQERCELIHFNQKRRNNRSLERFYDAKYIDTRTGKKASGQELSSGRRTRNRNLSSENLRIHRGEKVSKGKRSIRTKRYFYQPNDIVKYKNRRFTVQGTHCKGVRVILKETGKSVKAALLSPYMFKSGIYSI